MDARVRTRGCPARLAQQESICGYVPCLTEVRTQTQASWCWTPCGRRPSHLSIWLAELVRARAYENDRQGAVSPANLPAQRLKGASFNVCLLNKYIFNEYSMCTQHGKLPGLRFDCVHDCYDYGCCCCCCCCCSRSLLNTPASATAAAARASAAARACRRSLRCSSAIKSHVPVPPSGICTAATLLASTSTVKVKTPPQSL